MILLPASLLSLALHASRSSATVGRAPTAVRQVAPDAGEKILREHLAFAPWTFLDARNFPDSHDDSSLPRPYRPALAGHDPLLRPRSAACPSGMSGCDAIGQPNKCCQDGTTCTRVDDASVGGIACCPRGASCGGQVGACPADAVSCPAELGGGGCIAGYVWDTTVVTATSTPSTTTVTSTRTTWVDGAPSTVVVTEIVTLTSSRPPATSTTTVTVTESSSSSGTVTGSSTVTGGAPWRPTGTGSSSSSSTEDGTSTQEGCPTGFYGCLATHGGGCCQTDRDCKTTSCPPQASTTIVSDGKTVIVPASDVPAEATSTCAAGWFLCASDAGDRPGCCPSGYDCGTASCFSTSASQTGSVQKQQPKKDGAGANAVSLLACCVVMGERYDVPRQ
ncbi:hypothetical protein ISF_09335 [Cordyceps fumosorosea ARSEF 2679]|uniref:GPI anchored protein n=1 Tax=Cordyceps fumosorosea (strain ARSEF 2679) TaxID=1081104 RepID=A0A167JT54_CORFA|nr:hypothetical protein ISF_09335 [Cordyceps fumosorosea ARSEF 2679]OAA50717.1 hypothetical protein ISF_09335 [Cordyceps fumosorosea ARSEF 2679]